MYFKEENRMAYKSPTPTVDIIIEHSDGIVIIERLENPLGYALPGGHIDYGESAEEAAIRETKEETGLDLTDIKEIGFFSNPDRDPREHKVSMVYVAKGHGTLKAGSDAKCVHIMDPSQLPKLQFDHDQIVKAYLRKKMQGQLINNYKEVS